MVLSMENLTKDLPVVPQIFQTLHFICNTAQDITQLSISYFLTEYLPNKTNSVSLSNDSGWI